MDMWQSYFLEQEFHQTICAKKLKEILQFSAKATSFLAATDLGIKYYAEKDKNILFCTELSPFVQEPSFNVPQTSRSYGDGPRFTVSSLIRKTRELRDRTCDS